jgi:hypothetical protein
MATKIKFLNKIFVFLWFIFQRIPLVPRISISPEAATPKPKVKAILKGKIDYSLENVESNFEADEKLVMDTWQQASLAVSHMVSSAYFYISVQ